MKRHIFTFCLAIALPLFSFAQLDKVFVLGEGEQAYEQLTGSYSQSLLEASGGNITTAFEAWLDMQQAIDRYAATQNYDLNGIKIWLHVFWAPDGTIDKIGFLLRPDSRLAPAEEIRALLAGFTQNYTLPIKSASRFNHYTGATFPTLSQRRG